MKISLILIFSLFLHLHYCVNPELLNALSSEVEKVAQSMPAHDSLINGITASGTVNYDACNQNDLDKTLAKYKFSQSILTEFKAAAFTQSMAFQTFHLIVNSATASISEFFGASRNHNGTIEIAFIDTTASGHTIQQYNRVNQRKCHRVWIFGHSCHNNWVNVPRGFTSAELITITNALRATAYNYVKGQIKAHPKLLAEFENYSLDFSEDNLNDTEIEDFDAEDPNNSLIRDPLIQDALKKAVENVPKLKNEFKDGEIVSSTFVQSIVSRGFTSFEEFSNIRELIDVKNEYFDSLSSNVRASIGVDESYEEAINTAMKGVLFMEENDWVIIRLIFSQGEGGDCKYAILLGRNNKDKNSTDWLIGDIQANFKLAPQLLVYQTTKSSLWGLVKSSDTKIVEKPQDITYEQMDAVFKFFEIVTLERFAELADIQVPQSVFPYVNNIAVATIMALMEGIKAFADTWKSVATAFKTTKKDSLLQIIKGTGFDRYASSGVMNRVDGLQADRFDQYLDEMVSNLEVPKDKQSSFKSTIKLTKFTDSTTWNAYDIAYSKGEGGQCKYVSLLINKETESEKYNILLADIKAEFLLAPDVMVIGHSLSVAGGIYESNTLEFKEVPKSITQDDINTLFSFFKIVAFKNFADMMNIKVEFPKLPFIRREESK